MNQLPTIDIKWKPYVLVKDRVLYFNDKYPNGSIITERFIEWDMEIVKATVIPDVSNPDRKFTWYSQAKRWDGYINKSSALENAESSAVWRWLWFLWIWISENFPTVDEMIKATTSWNKQEFKKKNRYERTLENPKFMKDCLDEEDFISKVKNRVVQIWEKIFPEQETNLRIAYKKYCGNNEEEKEVIFD